MSCDQVNKTPLTEMAVYVVLVDECYNCIVLATDAFDLSAIKVGAIVQLGIVIPYDISSQRRKDIIAHHVKRSIK